MMQQWLSKREEPAYAGDRLKVIAERAYRETTLYEKVKKGEATAEERKEHSAMVRERLINVARKRAPEAGPKRPVPIRKATDKSEPTSPELYFAPGSARLTSAQMEPFVLSRPPPASWGLDSLGAFKKPKVATCGSK